MALVEEVKLRVEKSGHTVWGYWLPTPGKHPADEIIQPIIILLGFLGVLALVLSGFLVVNTIAAILTQQVRHIGIMKAIGARRGQIVRLYLGMVVVFGVLSLLVAVPLGAVAAAQFTAYMANMINFDVQSYSVPANVLAVEVAVGLAVPLLAALVPVIGGTRITVREAMSGYGLASIGKRQSLLDRLLGHLRGVSRPLLLSLRNTFRRKARVTLTLITLTLGGGIFIGVMSVHASMMATLDTAIGYWNHEVSVDLRRPYLVDRVIGEAMAVPGVKAAEMWGQAGVERVRPDGSQSQRYFLVAPPAETDQIEPILIDGRWLLPEDENAIVLNTLITRDEPDIRVGDEITLRMDKGGTKIETTWRVVGIVRGVMTGHIAYVNYPYYARVTGMAGRANALRVQIDGQGREAERQMAQALEAHLNGAGLDVHGWSTTSDMRAQVENQLNIIVVMLMGMSVIMALVGALGLMGTMSINVLERTREIGVMRAIGASGRAVLEIVIVEGMIIGGISWGLGTLLAVPLSKGLSAVLGAAVIHSSLDYVFDVQGMLLWLVLALALAALASYLPARRASQITVRDVLAYE
jgi:putative ABC transport system permease protein